MFLFTFLGKVSVSSKLGFSFRPIHESCTCSPIRKHCNGWGLLYQQLLIATNNFSDSNLIKNGHSGDLFKGVFEGVEFYHVQVM